MLNAVTKGLFDTDLKAFAGFGEMKEYDNSWEITASELFSGLFGGTMGMHPTGNSEFDEGNPTQPQVKWRHDGGSIDWYSNRIQVQGKLLRKVPHHSLNRLLASGVDYTTKMSITTGNGMMSKIFTATATDGQWNGNVSRIPSATKALNFDPQRYAHLCSSQPDAAVMAWRLQSAQTLKVQARGLGNLAGLDCFSLKASSLSPLKRHPHGVSSPSIGRWYNQLHRMDSNIKEH